MNATISVLELQGKLAENKVCLLDVRRKADFEKSPLTIAGAVWHDPEKIEEWRQTLASDQELVVYCVRGGGGKPVGR